MPLRSQLAALFFFVAPLVLAQATASSSKAIPDWQTAAGGHQEFEVASVRQDTSGVFKPPSIALSADNGSQPADGLFHADFPLPVYIEFAYKIWLAPEQWKALLAGLPKWVNTDRFLIEARSPGKPTKDQVRLMMQSLLAQRFGLRFHFETQNTPVLIMTLAKLGTLGPRLIPHDQAPPCPEPGQAPKDNSVFPTYCGSYVMHPLPDRNSEMGSRDTTMQLLANSLTSLGGLGRPVVDRTGLTGRYDFTIQFSFAASQTSAAPTDSAVEPQGPTLLEAVHDQLGLKLERGTAPLEVPVIDHIDGPSEN